MRKEKVQDLENAQGDILAVENMRRPFSPETRGTPKGMLVHVVHISLKWSD